MTDPAPRRAPRWGEYATPEEVAALRGVPAPPDPATRIADADAGPAPASGGAAGGGAATASTAARWDVPVTIGLLLFGVWNLLSSIPGFLALDEAMRQSFAVMPDAPDASFGTPTRIVGYVLFAVWALVLVVAVLASIARLRAGRVAFFVPLAAGAVALLALFLGVMVVVLVEPGLAGALAPA